MEALVFCCFHCLLLCLLDKVLSEPFVGVNGRQSLVHPDSIRRPGEKAKVAGTGMGGMAGLAA